MKVQIINLEAEDDHVSTRDRLNWAKAERAVLVWPRRGRPLSRQLDLAIVQRHARQRGIEIGLIAYEPSIVTRAARLGIPVFDSLDEIPTGEWAESAADERHAERRSAEQLADLRATRDAVTSDSLPQLNRRARVAVTALAAIAVLSIIGAIGPSAQITLQPVVMPYKRTVAITVDAGGQNNSAANRIPGQVVTTKLSGEMRANTTGSVRQPSAVAEGEVVFVNLTEDAVELPAGSGVRAGEVRFLTTRDLSLEAGSGSIGTVPIAAALPGVAGNVAAEAIDSVEGPTGFLVTVSNPQATAGGRDVRGAAVSEDDQTRLRQVLVEQLLAEAESLLMDQLEPGQMLAPGSLRLSSVLDEQLDREVGEIAPTLGIQMSLEVEALAFWSSDAAQAIEQAIVSSLSSARLVVADTLEFLPIESEADSDETVIEFQARAQTAKRIELSNVLRTARGAPMSQVGVRLQQTLGLASPADVEVHPSWIPWMPWLDMRIAVQWEWESN